MKGAGFYRVVEPSPLCCTLSALVCTVKWLMILVLADSCGGELDAQFLAFLAAAFCLELAVFGGQVVTSRSVICAATRTATAIAASIQNCGG